MGGSYCVGGPSGDGVLNEISDQLRHRAPILPREPLDAIQQRRLDPDGDRFKLRAHNRDRKPGQRPRNAQRRCAQRSRDMALMTIVIDDPSPQLEKRSSKVAYATRCLQIIASELGRCGGHDSSGEIVGAGSDGQTKSLGQWTYDVTASGP
jgi:hypothetical protein